MFSSSPSRDNLAKFDTFGPVWAKAQGFEAWKRDLRQPQSDQFVTGLVLSRVPHGCGNH